MGHQSRKDMLKYTQLSEIPDGEVVTGKGKILAIPENQRDMFAAVHVLEKDHSYVLVLATEKHIGSQFILQFFHRCRDEKFTEFKKALVSESLLKAIYEKTDRVFNEVNSIGEIKESEIVQKVFKIVGEAVLAKASDIHIEKREDDAAIKIRRHGEMSYLPGYESFSPAEADKICSVIYTVMAESDSKDSAFNAGLIQQAAVKMDVIIDSEKIPLKLRFQSVPVYPSGFDVVMRILPVGKNEKYTPLKELGYEDSQIKLILEGVSKAVGTVIIAGVTGSGKSTTLKTVIMWMNEDRGYSEKIFTVEDPPEYIIPRVSQIPVARRKDDKAQNRRPFEDAIKACMRADPDVIMPGEIRDKDTGDLLKKAVQSGHRVLTTVHAASSLGVIARLIDFGISNSTLASHDFVSGLIYQKLMARLCPDCSIPLDQALADVDASRALLDTSERLEKTFKQAKVADYPKYMAQVRVKGSGCNNPACKGGIVGRTVCAEIVRPDLTILQCFQSGDMLAAVQHLRNKVSDGKITTSNMVGKSAMAHAFYKMIHGEVDPIELERSFGNFSMEEITGIPSINSSDYEDKDTNSWLKE